MGNSTCLNLVPNQKYKVIKEFIDFDNIIHLVNEEWIFLETNFLPYDDGVTLHVKQQDSLLNLVYRLQWIAEEQTHIIENFNNYVIAI